jgi:hypothetical protein
MSGDISFALMNNKIRFLTRNLLSGGDNMGFLSRIFLSVLMTIFFSASFLTGQEHRVNIAVLDLDPTGIAKPDAQFLSDRLRTELFETGKFQIVEREKMNEILKEQGFQQTGCTSVECVIEIGQLLNVQIMVAGNIGKIEDLYSLSIRMIDVTSGAIIRTATKDYEGRLSEVLTDVVPEVARELAAGELGVRGNQEPVKKQTDATDKLVSPRYAILLEGGLSSLTFASDVNKEIEKLNTTISPDMNELGGLFSLGLELEYAVSADWQLKLGFIAETPLANWQTSLTEYSSKASIDYTFIEIERKNRFVNTYLGINYALWNHPAEYKIFVGFDIGSTSLSSEIYYNFKLQDGSENREESNTYNYSVFLMKFTVGGTYFLSRVVSAGMSLHFKNVQSFDISDQNIPPDLPEEFEPVFFPNEINASGILFCFYLGFHF